MISHTLSNDGTVYFFGNGDSESYMMAARRMNIPAIRMEKNASLLVALGKIIK